MGARWLGVVTFAALCALLAPRPASAGVNIWTGTGPEGGTISNLAIDPAVPSTMYAGGDAGIFRSTNGGRSWSAVAVPSLCPLAEPTVVIDPRVTTNVYVSGSCTFGRSEDGGETWADAESGRPGPSLAIDPLDPRVLYSGGSAPFMHTGRGIYRSDDAGRRWRPIGLEDAYVASIAVDGTRAGRLYAAAFQDGVFRSTDGGQTWAAGAGIDGAEVHSVAIDPGDPNSVHAAGSGGIFVSHDAGATWTRVPTGFGASRVVAAPTDPPAVYAVIAGSVIRTTDAWKTWETTFPRDRSGRTILNILTIAVAPSGDLFLGTIGQGILRGRFRDETFASANVGLAASWAEALALDPASAALYVGTITGPTSRSDDGGLSWRELPLVPTGDVRLWAAAPGTPPVLYGAGETDVARTVDGGATWTAPVTVLPGGNALTALAVDPLAPPDVYAGVNGRGVWKSVDGGLTWEPRNEGFPDPVHVNRFAFDPATPSTVYVATNEGIFRSTDGALRWSALSPPRNPLFVVAFTSYALAAPAPGRLLAVVFGRTGPALASSSDGGEHWAVGASLPTSQTSSPRQIIVDPADAARIYVNAEDRILSSRDGGATWYALGRGLPGPIFSRDLVLDRARPHVLHVALGGHGVLTYEDRCGDGIVDAYEGCDDGNGTAGDGCRADCGVERGGDGVVDVGEECDDGNLVDGDGCDSNQTFTGCRNGIVTAGEECDDGNTDAGDRCGVDCRIRCVAAADCDDGDVCTDDLCDGGACDHWPAPGIAFSMCSLRDAVRSRACDGEDFPPKFRRRLDGTLGGLDAIVRGSVSGADLRAMRRRVVRSLRSLWRQTAKLHTRVGRQCRRHLRDRLRNAALVVAGAGRR